MHVPVLNITDRHSTYFLLFLACSNPAQLRVPNRTTIFDSQFDASSYNDPFLSPRNARLTPANFSGWRTAPGNSERWIQVDFLKSTKVTAVLTQGTAIFIIHTMGSTQAPQTTRYHFNS